MLHFEKSCWSSVLFGFKNVSWCVVMVWCYMICKLMISTYARKIALIISLCYWIYPPNAGIVIKSEEISWIYPPKPELLGKITQHRWNNLVNAWIIGSNCISTLKNNSSWSKKCSWCFTSSWISRDKLCSLDQRSKGAACSSTSLSFSSQKDRCALFDAIVCIYTRLGSKVQGS